MVVKSAKVLAPYRTEHIIVDAPLTTSREFSSNRDPARFKKKKLWQKEARIAKLTNRNLKMLGSDFETHEKLKFDS